MGGQQLAGRNNLYTKSFKDVKIVFGIIRFDLCYIKPKHQRKTFDKAFKNIAYQRFFYFYIKNIFKMVTSISGLYNKDIISELPNGAERNN